MKYFIFFVCLLILGCASVQKLDGGAADEMPPKVVTVKPDSASLQNTSNSFVFVFNEYIKTNKINELLLISPSQSKPPTTTIKGKKLTILLNDSIKKNTTYTINFNGSIQDVNESNPINNYSYIMSTGDFIDSLSITGKLIDLQTNTPCSGCRIQLYKEKNDSAILTKKPDYIAIANELGQYNLKNLPNTFFNAIALKDDNLNLLLNDKELVSLSKKINTTNTQKDTFYLFPQENTKPYKPKLEKKTKPGELIITSIQPISSDSITLTINNKTVSYIQSSTKDTIYAYYSPKSDTARIKLITDIDTFNFTKIQVIKSLSYTPKIKYKLLTNSILQLKTNVPIKQIDYSKINILNPTQISIDSIQKLDIYKFNAYLSQPIKDSITIYSNQALITDFINKVNTADTSLLTFIKTEINTFTLQIKIPHSQHIILLKSNNKTIRKKIIQKSKEVSFNNIPSGKYTVAVIVDNNNNYKWDTGNIFTKKPPEPIHSSEEFEIRENWDKTLKMNLL